MGNYLGYCPDTCTSALPSLCAWRGCLQDPAPKDSYCAYHRRMAEHRSLKSKEVHRRRPEGVKGNWWMPGKAGKPGERCEVYIVQIGKDGPIKIGRSSLAEKRISALRSELPFDLEVHAVVQGSPSLELALHRLCDSHCIRGEWFHPHPDVLRVVDAAKAGRDALLDLVSGS